MRVILLRHPAPDITAGVCYGRLDVGLSADGAAAAQRMCAALAESGTGRVVSSPARRCRAVAGLLAAAPVVDARLQELDFGAWEGLAWDAVPREALDAWAADPLGFAPPGGESGAQLIARVRAAAEALLSDGRDCIVVSHGGPLRLLPALLRGEAPDLLAAAPALGSIRTVHVKQARALSPAHSAATADAPSTSPV